MRQLIVSLFVYIVLSPESSCLESAGEQVNSSNWHVNHHQQLVRPFYNIAHMANSIREVKYYLSKGANAMEADVTFSPNGTALYTFHGYPCDCFRHCNGKQDILEYLKYIRSITIPESPEKQSQLALIFFDLKLNSVTDVHKGRAGKDFAGKVMSHLFTEKNDGPYSEINVLMSIPHTHDVDFVLSFMDEVERLNLPPSITDRIGWDVGMNDPVDKIASMWKKLPSISNIWQGDGRTNCISPFFNIKRLKQVISTRNNDDYISKVYHWTVDLTASLRASLKLGVDAIITNHPERLVKIIKEPQFSRRFKMAQRSDPPWDKVMQDDLPFADENEEPSRIISDLEDKRVSIYEFMKEFVRLRSDQNWGNVFN